MRVLFVGDVVGRAGRGILESELPRVIREYGCDYVVVNGENAAGGRGITPSIAQEMFRLGADAITTGNHVWDRGETLPFIQKEDRLLRACNYPKGVPGQGMVILRKGGLPPVGIAQLCGRVFMTPIDCPFQIGDRIVEELHSHGVKCGLIDFHAEATSEKQALGRYLDGRISAVVGTHTHVPTADETIFPGGTAYITDVGMTGPYASIIGVQIDKVLPRFLYATPSKFEPATGDVRFCAVAVDIDHDSGKAQQIQRIRIDGMAGMSENDTQTESNDECDEGDNHS